MIRANALFALSVAIMSATPTAAQHGAGVLRADDTATRLYDRIDSWFVYKGPQACFALNEYVDGDMFSISANFVTNSANLNLYSSRFRSVSVGQDYRAEMVFYSDGRRPSHWRSVEWRGGGQGRIASTNLDARAITRDIAAFQSVGFLRDGVVLGNYSLASSARAMDALRGCELEIEAVNPTDPFTGERE